MNHNHYEYILILFKGHKAKFVSLERLHVQREWTNKVKPIRHAEVFESLLYRFRSKVRFGLEYNHELSIP